jgi:hypothetical protein
MVLRRSQWSGEDYITNYLPDIRVAKSRRLRWVGLVARMGERSGACRVLVGKPEGR